LIPRDRLEVAALKRRLLAGGIFPPFIKYPGGPKGGYFCFVISREHTQEQLERLLDVLISRREQSA